MYRLTELNINYEAIKVAQVAWPEPVSDPKQLYRNFYDLMNKGAFGKKSTF